jgi:sugar phosphate isomerase/epimerase
VILGYNTNGFTDHGLSDAVHILAEIGYRSVAVTLDQDALDPPDHRGVPRAISLLKPVLQQTGLQVTIETGARFILDPRRKHQPTLVSGSPAGRRRRLDYLEAAIDVAGAVGADCVSLWSGIPDDDAGEAEWFRRLEDGLGCLLDHAEAAGVRLAFEPEPGMFIDTMSRFEQLHKAIDHPMFGLTLDIGHVHCLQDGNLLDHLLRWRGRLWNIHIEDMRAGVHEHLPFGEGEIDFRAVFDALHHVQYTGPLHVELLRHSHDAVNMARASFAFLSGLLSEIPGRD